MADFVSEVLLVAVPVVLLPVVVPLFVDVLTLLPLVDDAIAEVPSLPFTLLATPDEPVEVLLP